MHHDKRALVLGTVLLSGVLFGRFTMVGTAGAQDGAPPTEASPTRGIATAVEGQPRYLPAIAAELTAMGVADLTCEANDEQRGVCRFHSTGVETERPFDVQLAYSDVTDTIYLYVNQYLTAASDGAHTDVVLRRLMELNWTMLLGRFEWDPVDGEVRLAMVLNTDSNFDRRAFRSAVRAIEALSDRYYPELSRLESTGH